MTVLGDMLSKVLSMSDLIIAGHGPRATGLKQVYQLGVKCRTDIDLGTGKNIVAGLYDVKYIDALMEAIPKLALGAAGWCAPQSSGNG